MGRIVGVDVSSYQNSTFSTYGLAFCIVKATESTGYTNPNYTAQVAHARSGGLVVGHYHFARGTDSAAEVAYFASVAKVGPGDIIALDWEESSVTPAARDAWLADVKARYPHNRVVLYCDVSMWESLDPTHSCGDGLWIADYNGGTNPDISQSWVFWQYSSSGGIDHSYGNFTSVAALVAWANALTPAPNPVPAPGQNTAAYRATHNPHTPISVDGNIGPDTVTALLYVIGLTTAQLQKNLNEGIAFNEGSMLERATHNPHTPISVDGNFGGQTTTALLYVLGISARTLQEDLNLGTLS